MRTNNDLLSGPGVDLTPRDLVEFEQNLKEALSEVVHFDSYSLFFPDSLSASQDSGGPEFEPVYREADNELLLPLILQGRLLGHFVARGIKLPAPRTLPPFLAALAKSHLEKLLLYKRSVTDPLTGLYTGDHFLTTITAEIERIQAGIMSTSGTDPENGDEPPHSGSLGIIVMDLDSFQRINENYGYLVGDDIVSEVGRLLGLVCPKHVTAARFSNDNFAILLPDSGPRACFQLAEVIRAGISKLSFDEEVTEDRITVTASLGYVNYPQGLTGPQFKRHPTEQARILVRKANKAVLTAKYHGRNRIFAYPDILQKGGKILETLPLSRVAVSLGRAVDAQVGQRFLVRSPRFSGNAQAALTETDRLVGKYPAMYKGEIVLMEVQEDMAFAEVLHIADPAWGIEPRDRLTLISDRDSYFQAESENIPESMPQKDLVTGLYAHRDFISFWTKARKKQERFSLTVIRLLEDPSEHTGDFQKHTEARTRKVAELVRSILGPDMTGGNFGLGGMIAFMPDVDPEEHAALIQKVIAQCHERLGFDAAAGTASYPCLNYTRADIMENCRKALDHALMLPRPMAAAFDSVSLNISADKLFMEGDLYGAVEEFKLSLIADSSNDLARNSLGICLAQLDKLDEARREFETVLENDSENLMALYNLGRTGQRLGNLDQARESYERCIALNPTHVFSLIRLGNLAEIDKDLKLAEKYYTEASVLPDGEGLTMRHLARLAMVRDDKERARECLHLALKANHNDAQAMHLLARLYLESGEDPQIAEVLARQSSALMPGRKQYWRVLVQALEKQGKHEEAIKAAARSAI